MSALSLRLCAHLSIPVRFQWKHSGLGFPGPVRTGVVHIHTGRIIGISEKDAVVCISSATIDMTRPAASVVTGYLDCPPLGLLSEGYVLHTQSGRTFAEELRRLGPHPSCSLDHYVARR